MKKFTRTLSVLTAVVLISSWVLTGCTSTPAKQTATSQTTTATEVTQTPTSNTDKFVTLKAYFVGDKGTSYDQTIVEINKKLKTDINASIEGTFISWSDWNTKYPLVFASGESFDMIYTSNWCYYVQEATKGAFYELTDDMLKTYAPKTYSGVTKGQWDQTKISGKMYMIPMSRKEFQKPVFIVRGDLMKKYGINEIKTKDDMLKYWDAIAKNEKNMYALAQGTDAAADDVSFLETLFSNSPYVGGQYFSNLYLQTFDLSDPKNIKVVDNNQNRLETYKLFKDFRTKGYWTKNALTQQAESSGMFLDGKSASALRQVDNINGLYIAAMKQHPEWEVQVVDIVPDMPALANPALNNGTALHATTTEPERALMAIDLFEFDKSYTDLVFYGIQGVHWEAVGEDSFKSLTDDNVGMSMGFGGSLMRKAVGSTPNYNALFENFNKKEYTPILQFFNFDDSNVKTEVAAVNSVFAKYRPILNLGAIDDVEKIVTNRDSELKKAGLEKIQAEYLKQAQDFCANYNK